MFFKESDASMSFHEGIPESGKWTRPDSVVVDYKTQYYIKLEDANKKLEPLQKDMAPILNFLGGTFLLHCRDEEMIKAVLTLKEFVGNK